MGNNSGELLTTATLLADGHTRHTIAGAVSRRELFRIIRGVYKRRPPFRDDYLTAIALKYPQVVYTGRTACEIRLSHLKKTRPYHARIDRTLGGCVRIGGLISATESRTVEREIVSDLPVVPAVQAAVDVHLESPGLAIEVLEKTFAGPRGMAQFEAELAQHARVPATFRKLITQAAIGADSATERRLFRRLRHTGFKVEQNFQLGPYRFDGHLRGTGLLIEIDSYDYHAVPGESERGKLTRPAAKKVFVTDRWKQNLAVRHGYHILRYSEACIDHHINEVFNQIVAAARGDEIAGRETIGVWKWHETHTGVKFAARYGERGGGDVTFNPDDYPDHEIYLNRY